MFKFYYFLILASYCAASDLLDESLSHANVFRAVDRGKIETILSFLQSKGNPDLTDSKGRSLLARAAYHGDLAIVEELLNAGASVDLADDQQNTPLYMASSAGHDAIVRLFVSKTKAINYPDRRGITALHIASKKGHSIVVDILCTSGALVNPLTHNNKTSLWLACSKGFSLTAECLLNHKALVDLSDEQGVTPLLISCYAGHIDCVRTLLTYKADVNRTRDNGISPLIIASHQDHEEIVHMLVNKDANVLYRSPAELGDGKALHYALQQDHQSISQYLYDVSAEKKAIEAQKALKDTADSLSSLHETIQSLSQKVGTLEQKDTIQTDQLNALITEHSSLWKIYSQKESVEREKRTFKEHPNVKAFYETIERKLIQLFLAYKVLDTGMIQSAGGKSKAIADGINLLGSSVSIPFMSLVTSAISSSILYMNDRSEKRHIQFIAKLATNITTLESEADVAVRLLCHTYINQIQHLTIKGSNTLAECAIMRFLKYMHAEHVHNDLALAPQIISTMATFKVHLGSIPYTDKRIETTHSKPMKWTDKGVFQGTGIVTPDERFFVYPGSHDYKHYAFRNGTEYDAEIFGYTHLS